MFIPYCVNILVAMSESRHIKFQTLAESLIIVKKLKVYKAPDEELTTLTNQLIRFCSMTTYMDFFFVPIWLAVKHSSLTHSGIIFI